MHEAVKDRHSARTEQKHLQRGKSEVYQIQYLGGLTDTRNELSDDGTRHFCLHYVHRGSGFLRDYRHHKNDNTHSADPVGKAAPKQSAVAERLNIADNGCTGGSKTARRLKKSVDIRRYFPRNDKRKRADARQHEPRKRNYHKAVPRI